MNMRQFTTLAIIGLWLLAVASSFSRGADAGPPPDVDQEAGRGLEFLAGQQGKDGAFDDKGQRVATTGLGLLAFLAAGDGPDVGKYGANVRGAIDFLVRAAPADGYFGKVDGSQMHGQAIATLALAEAWGLEETDARRVAIGRVVQRAVRVILAAQKVVKPPQFAGGWGEDPAAIDSDLPTSAWNALALRAALQCGVDVPPGAIARAMGFVLKCHHPGGGFTSQPAAGDASIAATGVAVVCLYLMEPSASAGQSDSVGFLSEHPIDDQTPYPFYAMYDSAMAAQQAGEPAWSAIAGSVFKRLVKMQQPDGSWAPSRPGEEPGVPCATAIAVLTLETPNRLLPAFQR
jgi:hypothetical protein